MPRPLSIAVGMVMILVVVGTILWLIARVVKRSDDPPKMIFKLVLTVVFAAGLLGFAAKIGFDNEAAVIIPFTCVAFGVAMSVIWAPHWGAMLARPLTSMFDGGDTEPDPEPLYSAAVAKRKLGKYHEAIAEIRKQLERFPTDFTGQRMLAEIQAEHLNDLPTAQVTIQRICQQKEHPPARIASAWMQLADWQMKYWQDPDAARESLEQIQLRFPDSEFAHVAAQRISHLASREFLSQSHERPTIALGPPLEDVGLARGPKPAEPAPEDLGKLATDYIRHLEQHPLDCEIREKLAMLYANHYGRADYAIQQLEQIVEQPGMPTREICRIYSTMADVHMKVSGDHEAARQALERLIERFPNSAAAGMARQRLGTLKLELRGRTESQSVHMGEYEQDLGLKRKRSERT
jgi:outer membrane protein assembly factor BamD (BamD/ComL family)